MADNDYSDSLIRELEELVPGSAEAVGSLLIAVDDGTGTALTAETKRLALSVALTLFCAIRGALTASNLTMATARLAGRTTAGNGAVEEISIGPGLSLAGGSLSALAMEYRREITGLTGGTGTDFDGVATEHLPARTLFRVVIGNEPQEYILVAGTSAEASAYDAVVPVDYAPGTNEKYWLRIA